MIISCHHIKKYHGANQVLEDVTLEIRQGDRVGLIGVNGAGKSTLLHLITGALQPDEGQLAIRRGTRIGYLAQIPLGDETTTVYQVLARGFAETLQWKAEMSELELEMSDQAMEGKQLERILKKYAELQESFERSGGYEMDARITQVAAGLSIPTEHFERIYGTLSGGEQTKVGLASLLIERPSLLLLDEPTNHLDLTGVEWLEGYLNDYDGTCLIVSHDRYFLDSVVTKVIELEDGEAFTYLTNYSGYLKEKEERLFQQFANYQEQQKQIKKMKETIKQLQEWGKIGGNEKFFRRAASMQKALDRMEKLKRPILERKATEFELVQADRSGKEAIKLEQLSKGYGNRTLFENLEGMLMYGEKVALVGDNGAGKSTLFKLLLGQEQPDAGEVSIGSRVEIGYLEQQDKLDDRKMSVLQVFREEAGLEEGEARGQLARYLFYGADVFKSVNLLSGGEWTRLRLALIMHKQPNLLLLDEPTNHLDIASREALEETLEDFPGTVLVISHDRYFINKIAQRIWELHNKKLIGYLGNFDDYKEKRAQLRERSDSDAAVETARRKGAPVKAHEGEMSSPEAKRDGAVGAQRSLRASASAEHDDGARGASRGEQTERSNGAAAGVKQSEQAAADAPPRRSEASEREQVRLERAIAGAEQRLAELDAALAATDSATDAAKLSQWFAEREEAQARLDALYERWLSI
jgi:ATP-binding cassette subfamily F protein 3